MRLLIIAGLCCALTFLGGCSALRIGYATAPDLVYWWVDDYIDFTSNQTPRAREGIRQWFAWHRRTQLPDYAAQLAKAGNEVMADTTPARICEWQGELYKRARTAYAQIAPTAADLALTITPEQIRHLEKRYEKANEEYRDDYLQPDPQKRAQENLKRTVDRAETLYGRLEDAQRARITEGLARSPFDPELWLAERHARQQDALQILRKLGAEGGGRDKALAALQGYVDRLERSPRDNYRRYVERLTEFNCAFAASLHNSTTPAQRRTARDNLAGWEGDLRAIAATPATAPGENTGNNN